VTSVSGRGVGMDVVKTNIESIGGMIDIATQRGAGTTFTIKIPLTLAIISALIVEASGQRYAVPQIAVLELVRIEAEGTNRVERINGAPVLRLRERLLPITSLAGVMQAEADAALGDAPVSGFVVVAQVGRQRFGILVDEVFHTEEIVVKPMSSKLRHIPLFAGNTILGDGAVVLIVDPNGIARKVGQGAVSGNAADQAEEATEAAMDKATLLVFKGGGSFKAVPLSLVTRIEEIDASKIEWLAGRPLIQYRGKLMPLVPADPAIEIRSQGMQALVVFSDGDRAMGLVVDEIVDIVEDHLNVEIVAERSDLIGSAVLRGRATDIVDVAHFLPLAYDDWARGPRAAKAKNPTLLLVDDSAFFRNLLTPVLKAAGYDVATAAGADEAIARLKADPEIGVVVADLEMPGRSGFDLVSEMRRGGGRISDLPVIALSGAIGPESVARARALAISDLVAKFDRSGLVAALAELDAAPLDKAA
jgi:two-component system chemotaxis sensor kinase CheA